MRRLEALENCTCVSRASSARSVRGRGRRRRRCGGAVWRQRFTVDAAGTIGGAKPRRYRYSTDLSRGAF
eukprot:2759598-Pyramimonas_sp.AAC.1